MSQKEVSILGSKWTVLFTDGDDFCDENGIAGYTEPASRRIMIVKNPVKDEFCNAVDSKVSEIHMKQTVRHEIIHAFLFESGISSCYSSSEKYGHDETMVDWIALQWEKIQKVLQELDCFTEVA